MLAIRPAEPACRRSPSTSTSPTPTAPRQDPPPLPQRVDGAASICVYTKCVSRGLSGTGPAPTVCADPRQVRDREEADPRLPLERPLARDTQRAILVE
jgi:hypothetical protein